MVNLVNGRTIKLIKHNYIEENDHCWALLKEVNQLLIVMKNGNGNYYVCGDWEDEIEPNDIEIIKIIPKPQGFENYALYYDAAWRNFFKD